MKEIKAYTFLTICGVLIIGACGRSTEDDSSTSSTNMPDYETTTLSGTVVNPSWGGRFENAVNRLAVSYTSSIDVDKRLYEQDILGSLKYA